MRLLVAEDQPDLNDVICKTLEKNHYTVDSCLDGEEALLCLSMTEYDAAILDIMMPKKNGLDVPVSYTHLDVYKRQVLDTAFIARQS